VIFKPKAIFKRSELQGLCPIFKPKAIFKQRDPQGLCPI
jgi:hypothetical protein